jgi:hypothetical protein
VMAKRSDRGSAKPVRCSGKPRAKPATEMSSDLANDHQGQQRAQAGLHPQAGYETAVDPQCRNFKIRLPQGRRPYKAPEQQAPTVHGL